MSDIFNYDGAINFDLGDVNDYGVNLDSTTNFVDEEIDQVAIKPTVKLVDNALNSIGAASGFGPDFDETVFVPNAIYG